MYDKLNLPSSSKTQASSFIPNLVVAVSCLEIFIVLHKPKKKHPTSCLFCSFEHYASNCLEYHEAAPEQRLNFINNHNLCPNFLGKHHMKSSCQSKNRCSKHECSILHHTTLHEALNQPHARSQPDRPRITPKHLPPPNCRLSSRKFIKPLENTFT